MMVLLRPVKPVVTDLADINKITTIFKCMDLWVCYSPMFLPYSELASTRALTDQQMTVRLQPMADQNLRSAILHPHPLLPATSDSQHDLRKRRHNITLPKKKGHLAAIRLLYKDAYWLQYWLSHNLTFSRFQFFYHTVLRCVLSVDVFTIKIGLDWIGLLRSRSKFKVVCFIRHADNKT